MEKSIVPLNRESEAFTIFLRELIPFVFDIRLEVVRFDNGDYAHLMKDHERLVRINWIRETLTNPDEIRKSYFPTQHNKENYIKRIYKDEFDIDSEVFIVGVMRTVGGLDFRTAFVAEPTYLENIRKGKLLWKKKNR